MKKFREPSEASVSLQTDVKGYAAWRLFFFCEGRLFNSFAAAKNTGFFVQSMIQSYSMNLWKKKG